MKTNIYFKIRKRITLMIKTKKNGKRPKKWSY